MKKRIGLLFLLVITFGLCVILGFEAIPKTNKLKENKVEESVVESTVQSTLSGEVPAVVEKSNPENLSQTEESLSAEDKAVKEEISKYSNTKVDFRHNTQEIIKGKSFDITFSEIDYLPSYKGVIYINGLGDEFVYNTDNGKLRYAIMESVIVEKTAESIDFETAKRIAAEYVAENCDISKYTMNQHKEIEGGYYFCYTRYIGGYPSNDRYSIQIGYDGVIVYISDFTDTFIGKELNYDKEFINAKIKEYSAEMEIDWDSIIICISDGRVAASYTVPEAHAIAVTPLE